MDIKNLENIRESFGRVVYTHKTHEKNCEICHKKATFIKIINIVLISITSGTLLTTYFTNDTSFTKISAIISTILLAFSIFQISFNPEREAEQHKRTALSLWKIREEYINLMIDILNPDVPKNKIIRKRNSLLRRLNQIYQSAPPTSPKAYQKAQEALKVKEEMTFSEEEIDIFLPEELKIKNIRRSN